MDDIQVLIDELVGKLERYNAELVQRQLEVERVMQELSQELADFDHANVRDFIDALVQARSSYTDAGDLVWRAKEELEGYRDGF